MTTEPSTETAKYIAVQQSDEFAALRKRLRGFMGAKIVGNINIALIFGLLQFVSTFLIAWYYSKFAAEKIDPTADKIRHEMGEK